MDDLSPQERFEKYFEGIWKRKWWAHLLPIPMVGDTINVTSYSCNHITDQLRYVNAHDEDNAKCRFNVEDRTTILGWRKVEEECTSSVACLPA